MPQAVEQAVTQKWRKEWAQWEAGGGIGGGSQLERCLISSSPRGSSSATEGRRWPPCPWSGMLEAHLQHSIETEILRGHRVRWDAQGALPNGRSRAQTQARETAARGFSQALGASPQISIRGLGKAGGQKTAPPACPECPW